MIQFQGVTENTAQILCYGDIWTILKKSPNYTTLRSSKSGVIEHIDALVIGKTCVDLGAGRSGKSSDIDHSVGIELLKTVNDNVETNDEWIRIYHKEAIIPESIKISLESAIHVSSREPTNQSSSIVTKVMK